MRASSSGFFSRLVCALSSFFLCALFFLFVFFLVFFELLHVLLVRVCLAQLNHHLGLLLGALLVLGRQVQGERVDFLVVAVAIAREGYL